MRIRLAICLCFCFCFFGYASAQESQEFKPMFNGQDLSGWVNVNSAPSTWQVKDRMLICSGKPIGEIRTEQMYQNFILELEWRHMKPKGNAGVFVWADDITARGQPFHRGIEVQVLENAYGKSDWFTTHGDIFPIHGAKMSPVNGRGGSRAFPTEERSKPSPNWNHYRIECIDGDIKLAVNGKMVTQGRECSPRKGYICLESEGGIVHYRNVRIKELPDSPIEAEQVAISNRHYRCLYSGVDLQGWQSDQPTSNSWQANDWVLRFDGKEPGVGLSSKQTFKDIGFIVDVRRKKEGASTFEIGGVRVPMTSKIGEWSRYEGTLNNGKAAITLNTAYDRSTDVPVSSERIAEAGPVRLFSQVEIEFANIYVRKLD